MADPLCLLHLSDIHFRAGKTWDSDPVLHALADFIRSEVATGLIPDFVVITGDLAFGGKAEEYQLARDWLNQELWPAVMSEHSEPLPHDRLLLVPGNHDSDRDRVDIVAQATQNHLLIQRDQQQIAKVLADATQRQILLGRYAAYLDFYGGWLGAEQVLPWWQRTIDVRGERLHIAGLDSAWMAWRDDDRGRLLLGRYQINQTVVTKAAEDAAWRIVLLHHPWDYLAEFDGHEVRRALHLHRDLLLRGHLHEPEASRVLPPDPTRACLELAAGCVYEDSRYPNAFQWIELCPSPKRVRVLFRKWIDGAWAIDRNQPGCPEGEHTFTLSTEPAHGADSGKSASPKTKSRRRPARRVGKTGVAPAPAAPREPTPAIVSAHTSADIREAAIAAITESLERMPALRNALAEQLPPAAATKARDIAAALCALEGDFHTAMRPFKAALPKAARLFRQKQVDVSMLRKQAHDMLGWMVVTTVMDGYEREDARLAQGWFDGAAFHIPLGRSPCVEVLTACWRRGKAEFSTEPDRYAYGKDDISPKGFTEIGFEDPNRLELGRAVDHIWRRVYQEMLGKVAPAKLSPSNIEELREWLDIQLEEKKRRLRLVIDRYDLDSTYVFAPTLQAIHDAVPQIHLIVVDSGASARPDVFVLPASQLAAQIYDCLKTVETLA